MTAAALVVHPLVPALRAGDVVQTWCRHHGRLVDHRYDPHAKTPLVCLICEEQRKAGEK